MSSGGKGGGQTSQVTIPKYIEDASKEALASARYAGKIDYVPYYGLGTAALTPMQENAMGALSRGMMALGLQDEEIDPLAGMPELKVDPVTGSRGYSSGDYFDYAVKEFGIRRPEQKAYRDAMFIDPITGELAVDFTPAQPVQAPFASAYTPNTGDYSGGGGEVINYTSPTTGSGNFLQDLSGFGSGLLDLVTSPFDDGQSNAGSVSSIQNQSDAYEAMGGFYDN